MPRLTKKQRAELENWKDRAQRAERALALYDGLRVALLDSLREELSQIARDAAEEMVGDLQITY